MTPKHSALTVIIGMNVGFAWGLCTRVESPWPWVAALIVSCIFLRRFLRELEDTDGREQT